MMHSALWDLSQGCNNHVGISESYKEQYQTGIQELHDAVQKVHPNAYLYCKQEGISALPSRLISGPGVVQLCCLIFSYGTYSTVLAS